MQSSPRFITTHLNHYAWKENNFLTWKNLSSICLLNRQPACEVHSNSYLSKRQNQKVELLKQANICRRDIIVPRRSYAVGDQGRRRVVVTGIGLITCLGVGKDRVWTRLVNGESGITAITGQEYEKIPSKVAGLVPVGDGEWEFNIDKYMSRSEQRGASEATRYAVVAAEEALNDAGWKAETDEQKHRTGVGIGMAVVSLEDAINTGVALRTKGYSRIDPFFVPRQLVNMASGIVSIRHQCKGLCHAVSTACTTGLHAIGDASRFIQHGDVDVMVCGGTEGFLGPLGFAAFSRMRALSTKFNDRPSEASRPFDKDRDGFVMAEGCGIVVLEEYNHAINRGANIYAEVLGYGLSADANHITAPCSDGDGAYRCMKNVLNDARVTPEDIGYINAHATSTPLGDAAESNAIQKLFQSNLNRLKVSSTKGGVGHLCGAAGSVEAIFTILACHTGVIPPTINLHNPDKDLDIQHVANAAAKWDTDRSNRIALTNSFGFGGTNASVCFKGIGQS